MYIDDAENMRRRPYVGVLETHANERLQTLLAQEAPVSAGVRTTEVIGRAYRRILQVAREEKADLTVRAPMI